MGDAIQWIKHVDSYVNSDATPSQQAASLDALTNLLGNGSLTLEVLVREMEMYLTTTDSTIRSRGILLLGELLSKLILKPLNSTAISTLIQFFMERLADWKALRGALVGCLALLKRNTNVGKVANSEAKAVAQFYLCNMQVQSLGQHDRKLSFQLIQCLLDHYSCAVADLGDDLVYGICEAIDQEKDAQCLLLTFSIVESLARLYPDPSGPLAKYAEDLFEILSSYFPIHFNHPTGENDDLKREELSRALMLAFGSTPLFEPFVVPLLLEKLSSFLPSAKLDSFRYLTHCMKKYGRDRMGKHGEVLWSSVKDATYLSPQSTFSTESEFGGMDFLDSDIMAQAFELLQEVILQNDDFISLIVADNDINVFIKSLNQYEEYDDILVGFKQRLHAVGRILSTCAKSSISSFNKVFEQFFPLLVDCLGLSAGKPYESYSDEEYLTIVKFNFGALYLCVELLAACRYLVGALDNSTSLTDVSHHSWSAMLNTFSKQMAITLRSVVRSNHLHRACVYFGVKGLELMVTFPGSFTQVPNSIYVSILSELVSHITFCGNKEFLWKLVLSTLVNAGLFLNKCCPCEKAASYETIVVEKMVSLISSDDSAMPISLKLQAAFEIGATRKDFMIRVVQVMNEAMHINLPAAYDHGIHESSKLTVELLDTYSQKLLPWFRDVGGSEEVPLNLALSIWGMIANSNILLNFGPLEIGSDLLSATMTVMKNAVGSCSERNQEIIITKAAGVLFSGTVWGLTGSNSGCAIMKDKLQHTYSSGKFSGRDECLTSLFAAVVIALHPQTRIPKGEMILQLFITGILNGHVPSAHALGSFVNKLPVEVSGYASSRSCSLIEALDAIFCSFIGTSTYVRNFENDCSGFDFSYLRLNIPRVQSVANTIVGLAWTGKGLLMRGHDKIKDVIMTLLGFLTLDHKVGVMKELQHLIEGIDEEDLHQLMKCAGDAFHIITSDSEECLNRIYHATIRPLYKQRFLSTIIPILSSLVVKSESSLLRYMVLRAFAHVVCNTPLAALVGEAKKLVPIMLDCLSMLSTDVSNKQIIYDILLVLSGILLDKTGGETAVENAPGIINQLIELSAYMPMMEHHDLLLSTLPAVESAMERFVSILNQYEIVSSHFCRADQERSNFIQYETSARSVVAEATCNSEQSGALFDIQVREFTQAQAIVMEKAREAVTWIDQHGRILDALRSSSIPEIKSLIEQTGSEEALSLTSAVIGAGVPWTIVPEPTQLQCHDIDREVSHLLAELAHGLASAVAAMQIYLLAMQRILPLNYITTSPVHAWAQILLSLKNLSSEVISIARRNATELVNDGHIDRFGSPRSNYDDLCFKLTNYSADILRMEEECSALEMSIGVETESEAKEHLVSAFMNYMQHTGLKSQEESIGLGPTIHERTMNNEIQMDFEEKQEHFPTILGTAVSNLFSDVKIRTKKRLDHFGEQRSSISSQSALEAFFIEFEEQIEKCVIVTNFLAEQKQLAGLNIYDTEADANNSNCMASWASIFRTNIQVCKNLIGNVADVIVPTLIKSVISFNSDVMDIFGSISQIRGLVDTALEQLIQVELERDYLVELESNYFVNVDLITEQQLALEEAAVKGRDLLSWEEAEELASQEETCRVQLDRLHQTWNQKDLQTSSLEKTETDINDSLVEAESRLQSLIASEPEAESLMKRQVLLAALFNQFSNLELLDETLGSSLGPSPACSKRIIDTKDSKNSGCSLSEYIWDFPGLQNSRAFFIWKVFLVDLLLESCLHDVAASFDQNLGNDQLADFLKKKLKNQFQEHIFRYLKNRVAPIFLTILDRKIEILMGRTESNKDPATDQIEMDYGAVRRIQLMLEEYCNVHETFKAARSAASIMKRQVDELKDAFSKTSLHIAQIEWMQNITSRPLEITRLITHKFLPNEDHLLPVILNTNRPKLLEGLRSSISIIARSLECLKSCEGSSAAAEGQLERALGWACGDPNPTFPGNVQAKSSGIPPQFHDHLIKRRNLLQEVRQNASDIMEICISISEFEASRDGIIRGIGDSGTWHQSYQSAITKLDVAYHSFARAEKEWRLAQSNMEAASNGLVTATNELSMASTKAKSASVNLQSTLLAMRDSAYEASVALSSYGGIVRGHTALTSECGSMLEEVLAITEGLHDVHNLGKEAALIHASLMEDLLKANAVLIPLESLLSKDVAAMTDAMTQEKEIKSEIAPIHGQAIFQSYYSRMNDALHIFKPMVPSLTSHVQGLFSLLTRLARAASLHAGNLHKALEGVGENLQGRSEEIDPLGADLTVSSGGYDTQKSEMLMNPHGEKAGDSFNLSETPLPDSEWISPPFSLSSGSTVSYGAESAEASIQDALGVLDETLQTSGCSSSQDVEDDRHEMPSTMTQESCSIHPVQNDEEPLLSKEKDDEGLPRASFTNIEPGSKVGKNAYAISVLRRVEMKLDGRDITDNREISVAEQVDFLLRQATDINNLCNMYEGWTPWI